MDKRKKKERKSIENMEKSNACAHEEEKKEEEEEEEKIEKTNKSYCCGCGCELPQCHPSQTCSSFCSKNLSFFT